MDIPLSEYTREERNIIARLRSENCTNLSDIEFMRCFARCVDAQKCLYLAHGMIATGKLTLSDL